MKIAVEGCAHGELEKIYESISHIEAQEKVKVDLLICCGDFQATRNLDDLQCMAVPPKYHNMCTFYKYYDGSKIAPILTIFIGGNHEASNYLQELPYGGWVAPNIYYLGYAGVINIAGVKIGGLSGIYKGHDYNKGHYEIAPYDESTKRSVYHIRNLEVFRLKQMAGEPINIFLSHDWPSGIYNHGNVGQLLRHKPYFAEDIESNSLGSKPCEDLLNILQPEYWFAAHLHTKFAAVISHDTNHAADTKTTKFLALDRCLPNKRFLQLIDTPHDTSKDIQIEFDLDWLTILFLTNHLLSIKSSTNYMPGEGSNERWDFKPTLDERSFVLKKFENNLLVPLNFVQTAPVYNENARRSKPEAISNPQTLYFCDRLGIDDPTSLSMFVSNKSSHPLSFSTPERKPSDSCSDFISFDDSIAMSPLAAQLPTPKWVNSDIKEHSITPLRVSLSLPSPKVLDTSASDTSKLETQSSDNLTPNSFYEDTSFDSDSLLISRDSVTYKSLDLQQNLNDEDEDIKKTPTKKFKRRNQEMYNTLDSLKE